MSQITFQAAIPNLPQLHTIRSSRRYIVPNIHCLMEMLCVNQIANNQIGGRTILSLFDIRQRIPKSEAFFETRALDQVGGKLRAHSGGISDRRFQCFEVVLVDLPVKIKKL